MNNGGDSGESFSFGFLQQVNNLDAVISGKWNLALGSFYMRELNVVICWWFHFTRGNFVTNNMIYYQHVNNPASYVGSLILRLKKFNWICSGNLCSHLWMANHDVKVVHEAGTTSKDSEQFNTRKLYVSHDYLHFC
jgi:hypothetical protein